MSLLQLFKHFFIRHRLNDPASKLVFDHYFFDFKYYLHQDASAEDFALILNIEDEKLDQISVAYHGSSFTKLINEYRYKHFMQELEHPFSESVPINTIIKLCGFENNETFIDFLKTKELNDLPSKNH